MPFLFPCLTRTHCPRRGTARSAGLLVLLWLAVLFPAGSPTPVQARPPAKAARRAGRPAAPKARPGASRLPEKETIRYGVYLQNSRIGALTTHVLPTTHESRPAIRMDALSSMKISALGSVVEISVDLSHILDAKGNPVLTRQTTTSQGRTSLVVARFERERIVCDLDAGGAKSQKVVPIPRGVKLAVDPSSGGNLPEQTRVGQKSTLYFFDPTTLTLVRLDSSVVRAETRTLGGKKRRVFLVRNQDTLTGASEAWVDEQGKLLENNAPALGLRLVREDVPGLDTARSYEPPRDFAVATSVRTTVKLPQARTTRVLKLRISGIPDRSLLLRDPRQQIAEETETNGKLTATYRIEARELPAVCLPAAAPGSTGPGLGDAPYLGLEQESIRKTAREIAEQETNRGVLARRIRAWVKAHMTKPTNIGAPRSAAEIMATREGVCRDYATLFAALARAVGVPTRLCTGLVYFQEGFFYHAWVECQLTEGDAGWFAFDPTLSDDFVDATHVKFGQGDPTEMYAAVRVVGQIQAEILEYR